MTNFEILPNEVLLFYFNFFDASELFYSFHGLNYRFNQLIQYSKLYLNFQSVRKSIFTQFCTEILSNEHIQNQIYSLHLSNEDTCDQINTFLSLFPLNKFPQLRSLTLTKVKQKNIKKLQLMLPLISNLHIFHLINTDKAILNYISSHVYYKISFLTIDQCSLYELMNYYFKTVPLLKYLHVKYVSKSKNPKNNTSFHEVPNLQQLTIDHVSDEFEYLKKFLKNIPNLKALTITSAYENIINAYDWEELITSSIKSLKNFQFQFLYFHHKKINEYIQIFQQFQTDFWIKQHHWLTDYILSTNTICIYTIPYMKDTYDLTVSSTRFRKDINRLINVKSLSLNFETIINPCEFYFPNIRSLVIIATENDEQCLKIKHIYMLRAIVNFSNLIHLNISKYSIFQNSLVFLHLLKEASQLSFLSINDAILISFFNDKELCEYFSRRIRKLNTHICSDSYISSLNNFQKVDRFCQIFANIQYLECNIDDPNDLLYLLNHLSKLSFLKIFLLTQGDPTNYFQQHNNEICKYNPVYDLQINKLYDEIYITIFNIWKN